MDFGYQFSNLMGDVSASLCKYSYRLFSYKQTFPLCYHWFFLQIHLRTLAYCMILIHMYILCLDGMNPIHVKSSQSYQEEHKRKYHHIRFQLYRFQ